jgi:hypothetical protein
MHQFSFWTYEKLGNDVSALTTMPNQISHTDPQAGELRGVHASMQGNRSGIYPEMSDPTLKTLINPPPALLAVGHTHRPLIRQVADTLIVNAGSVGLPFDRDQRAAYTKITTQNGNWHAETQRIPYNVDQAERDFFETGFISEAGPLAHIIQLELKLALSQLYYWTRQYMQAILDESISVEQATKEYLADPMTKPYWEATTP